MACSYTLVAEIVTCLELCYRLSYETCPAVWDTGNVGVTQRLVYVYLLYGVHLRVLQKLGTAPSVNQPYNISGLCLSPASSGRFCHSSSALLQVAVLNNRGMNKKGYGRPTILALSRQGVPNLPGTSKEGVEKGGYIVHGGDKKPDCIILATGKTPPPPAPPPPPPPPRQLSLLSSSSPPLNLCSILSSCVTQQQLLKQVVTFEVVEAFLPLLVWFQFKKQKRRGCSATQCYMVHGTYNTGLHRMLSPFAS